MAYAQMPPSKTWVPSGITKSDIKSISIGSTFEYSPVTGDLVYTIDDGFMVVHKNVRTALHIVYDFSKYAGIQLAADSSFLFQGFENVETIYGLDKFDTSNVVDFSRAFRECMKVKSLNLSGWVTSKTTDLTGMLQGCLSLETLNVSGWDTSNVTSMENFIGHPDDYKNESLTALDLSGWNVGNCVNLSGAFANNAALTTLNLTGWSPAKCESMKRAFIGCESLQTLNIPNWDTSSCVDMRSMFHRCYSLTSIDVANWDTGNCETMHSMFAGHGTNGATTYMALKNLDVSGWNTGKVTDMSQMFYACNKLGSIDVSGWDVSNVTSFDHFLARGAVTINGVENWVTSSATNFNAMFHGATNTSLDVTNFVTSKVKTFSQMFENMTNLTNLTGLDKFDTSAGLDFQEMFRNCAVLRKLDLSSFDTSNATDGEVIAINGDTTKTLLNMFEDMPCLEEVILGSKFRFNGDGTTTENVGVLPTPPTVYWYDQNGIAYTPSKIPNGAGVYTIVNPVPDDPDGDSVMTVNRSSLEGIADAIRINLGTDSTYLPSEMAAAIGECHLRHYATVIPGSGTTELSFHVPFEPDLVYLMGSDPTVMTTRYNVLMSIFDLRSFGMMGGFVLTFKYDTNLYESVVTSKSAPILCVQDESGMVTVHKITTETSGTYGIFADNVQYTVTAVKCIDKTDKERITEMVNGLTESGSLTLNRAKVEAAFTTEEWAALTATKPGWKFLLF